MRMVEGKARVARASFIREAPDIRRQSLIDATARCLAEKGVGGTSVRAICQKAGVSAGLLTHYFSGIDALIVATYRDVGGRVLQAGNIAAEAAGDDPRARLEAFVLATFRPPVLDPDLLATWIAFWSLTKTDPEITAAHAEHYGSYRRSVEVLISDCAPGLSSNEIRLAAIGVTALVDGLWLELCLDPTNFTSEEASAMTRRWIAQLLGDIPG